MISTEEAAVVLAERGVLVKGRGKAPHPPTARTVEAWCRAGALKCEHVGQGRRGIWLVNKDALEGFQPPKMGTRTRKALIAAQRGRKTTTMTQLHGTIDQQVQQLAQFADDDEVWEQPDTRTFYVGDAEGQPDEYRLVGTVAEYRQQLLDLIEAR